MTRAAPPSGPARTVSVAVRERVGWVTLDRPDALNAMDVALMEELREALGGLARDPAVRCVVLRGAGRAFCAGGDVRMIAERQREAAAAPSQGALVDRYARLLERHAESVVLLHEMPKPTVAVVHGHAVGGGLALALAADLRLMAASTRLRVGFAARSLSGDFGISYLLAHTVGAARARELMLLDPEIDAARAERLGLVTAVHPDDDLARAAEELAARLAAGPTIAFGRMTDNVRAAETAPLLDVLRAEAINQRVSASTADALEAGAAFAERRAASFTGT